MQVTLLLERHKQLTPLNNCILYQLIHFYCCMIYTVIQPSRNSLWDIQALQKTILGSER